MLSLDIVCFFFGAHSFFPHMSQAQKEPIFVLLLKFSRF